MLERGRLVQSDKRTALSRGSPRTASAAADRPSVGRPLRCGCPVTARDEDELRVLYYGVRLQAEYVIIHVPFWLRTSVMATYQYPKTLSINQSPSAL